MEYIPTVKEARDMYDFLKCQIQSRYRKRNFVFGALYKHFYRGCATIDPASYTPNDAIVLEVTLPNDTTTEIRIFRLAKTVPVVEAVVNLGMALPRIGNARKESGDQGEMYGLGYRSTSKGLVYKVTRWPRVAEAMTEVSLSASEVMRSMDKNTFDSIRKAEEEKEKFLPLREMGGANGPGSCIMFSKNLANASHYDVNDKSRSFAIWAEERIEMAKNWFFVLPDVQLDGSMGVCIRLSHGTCISWDGTLIRHCTSVTEPGASNNVYGCMFGSCRE